MVNNNAISNPDLNTTPAEIWFAAFLFLAKSAINSIVLSVNGIRSRSQRLQKVSGL
ncbi:MAG: hypothetical protein IT242_04835 [Bacteroidia bacterium]|nr:hypothetical protein [Bacteroidia bacterium]